MTQWDVHLVYIDEKSKKFWRARVDGGDLLINWGRIGTDGQEKVKSFGDASGSTAERDKVAASKRKKGYVDEGGASPATATVPSPVDTPVENEVALSLNNGGRAIEVRLEVEESRLCTVVVEQYDSAESARTTLARIKKALEADGYRPN